MKKLIIIFLVGFHTLGKGQEKLPVDFVGFWHNAPEYIMGWQDCYNFFPDSTFRFHFDKLHCYENCSTFYYKGSWDVVKDTMVLYIKEKKVIIGGEFMKSVDESGIVTISYAGSDSIIKLDIPEVMKLKLKMIFNFDNSTESIFIDDQKFWKIDKDPYKQILD